MFKIRPTSLEDENVINELLVHCFPTLMKGAYNIDILNLAIPIISKARPELLSSGTFFMANTDSGEVIGCGGWTKYSPANQEIKADIGHIRHFATHPSFIRKGVAREIYNACKKQATANGINVFECFSTLNAKKFYESLGFKTIQPTTVPLTREVQFPCLLMRQYL